MRSTWQGLVDGAGGSRVALYAAIRRDARAGRSNRALQRKHRVGYRTVTAALNSAWPEPRKGPPKRGSRLDPYRAIIDGWLRARIPAGTRPLPSVDKYDQLLPSRRDIPNEGAAS